MTMIREALHVLMTQGFQIDCGKILGRTIIFAKNHRHAEKILAPLVPPDADDPGAVRFDALVYGIELAYFAGERYARARNDHMKKVRGIAAVAAISR